jgi:hypothetical protein
MSFIEETIVLKDVKVFNKKNIMIYLINNIVRRNKKILYPRRI